MRPGGPYRALATDYDGTIAEEGRVDEATLASLHRLRDAGFGLVLVTGRELDDLRRTFPGLRLFDRVVAENGGVLFRPSSREAVALGPPPPRDLVDLLRELKVDPLSVGRVVLATRDPHEPAVQEAIDRLGLGHRVIRNKGAVMVLPAHVDKASGLAVALAELGFSPAEAVAVGDAENDLAFLSACGWPVAVGNAVPALAERVDLVLDEPGPAGVRELVERLLLGGSGYSSVGR